MTKPPFSLDDSEVLDRAGEILETNPELALLGGALAAQLHSLAALLRGEPTHDRGIR